MTMKANIGHSPWNALYLGLTDYVPLSYGQVSIVVGVLITFIALAVFASIRPVGSKLVDVFNNAAAMFET